MPQKNSSIMLTLLSSVFMMMLVASLFHLPDTSINGGLTSSLLEGLKTTKYHTLREIPIQNTIEPVVMGYLPE